MKRDIFRWVVLLDGVGAVDSNTTLCFLPVPRTASPDKGELTIIC